MAATLKATSATFSSGVTTATRNIPRLRNETATSTSSILAVQIKAILTQRQGEGRKKLKRQRPGFNAETPRR
jgi:hypothetical protein